MTKRFGYSQQPNCSSRYHMGLADINSQKSKVACFEHNHPLGSLPCNCQQRVVYCRVRMPTPPVINPILSHHYLRLFNKVGNWSVHLLEFLIRNLLSSGRDSKRDREVEVQEDGQYRSEYALMTLDGIWSQETMDQLLQIS